ncbi:uncharacterized protein LOC110454260 [Mizuhopecten yessoensis]|uniref:Uncharacterized protein n=1 Tax=Mizuhopecten yessoensis TaxID=6573 RepID=A0A210QFP8_MIZYE|nr:uncharacterized protein LOC110454260 [Mizuhopecten yessoensis]OWF47529.1 hypothetical protein KP79_PYT15591 [Mizuhopecten yessoensis]
MSAVLLLLIGIILTGVSDAWKSAEELHKLQTKLEGISQLTLLVTVNDTWNPSGCIQTIKTPLLTLGKRFSQIEVGTCDYGAITVRMVKAGNGRDAMSLDVMFESHVIVDASHPECHFNWNGSYLVPTAENPKKSLLPGCFVMDSREGYHMTYYWFHLLDWHFG